MTTSLPNIQQLMIAGALASGLASAGVATPAQTAAASIPTTVVSAAGVSVSAVDAKAKRQAELESANADARRVVFRYQGTSL